MVVGESQILGQLRQALHVARQQGTLGRTLSELGSLALRAGKRTHAETSVGGAGASLVSVGLQTAARHFGAASPGTPALAGRRVLVVGAGAMSGLAVASITRAGATELTVTSRTRQRAERLAASAGGRAGDLASMVDLMAAADLVVTCTGASGHVISADMVQSALSRRAAGGTPLVLLDLAMPRDVDPEVASLDGVALTDLGALAAADQAGLRPGEAEVAEVRRIMAEELATHLSANRAAAVTPTVVALRAKAAGVVDSELARLVGRLDLDAVAMAEVEKSMRRVTDKLLHDPTVRVKELAGSPGGDTYEDALRVLFDLDQATVQAVAQADADLAGWPQPTTDGGDAR
jgi:glutamyl-tRNA reductase